MKLQDMEQNVFYALYSKNKKKKNLKYVVSPQEIINGKIRVKLYTYKQFSSKRNKIDCIFVQMNPTHSYEYFIIKKLDEDPGKDKKFKSAILSQIS